MPRSSRIKSAAGSGRHAEEVSYEIHDRHPALGGCDHHRGLHRQPLHRDQARPDAPVAAAVSAADPKAAAKTSRSQGQSRQHVANLPAAGVKAKGISEKAILEKTAAERPTWSRRSKPKRSKADDEARRCAGRDREHSGRAAPHTPAPREKTAVRAAIAGAARDAGRRGRAAARLLPRRRSKPRSCRMTAATPTTSRAPRSSGCAATMMVRRARRKPRVPRSPAHRDARTEAARIETPAGRDRAGPSPAAAADHGLDARAERDRPFDQATRPPYAANAIDDPRRPTPPAEIPVSPPLDLRAEVAEPSVRERTTAVAEDVLSAAKSVFHAVLPSNRLALPRVACYASRIRICRGLLLCMGLFSRFCAESTRRCAPGRFARLRPWDGCAMARP